MGRNKQCVAAGLMAATSSGGVGLSMAAAGQDAQSSTNGKTESPFYCNIKALTPAERQHHKELTDKLNAALVETKEQADGYTFRLKPGAISLVELADWVDAERRCCPFFDLSIETERENGPVRLKVTGRDGVKQFIRAEFKDLMAQ